jgi:hypothetical protein
MPVIKTPSIVPEPQPESEEQPNEPSEPQPESEPEPQSEEPSEEQVEQPEESVQSKPPFGGVSVFPKLTIPGSLPQLGSLTTKLPVGAPTTGPSLPKLQVGTLPSIGGGFLKPMTGAI